MGNVCLYNKHTLFFYGVMKMTRIERELIAMQPEEVAEIIFRVVSSTMGKKND